LTLVRTRRLERGGRVSLLDGGAMAMQSFPDPPPGVDTASVLLLLIHADGSQNRIASWMTDPIPVTVRFTGGWVATAQQPLVDVPLWDASGDGRSIVFIHGGGAGYPALVAVSPTGQTIFRKSIPWPRVPVTTALYDHAVDSLVKHL